MILYGVTKLLNEKVKALFMLVMTLSMNRASLYFSYLWYLTVLQPNLNYQLATSTSAFNHFSQTGSFILSRLNEIPFISKEVK